MPSWVRLLFRLPLFGWFLKGNQKETTHFGGSPILRQRQVDHLEFQTLGILFHSCHLDLRAAERMSSYPFASVVCWISGGFGHETDQVAAVSSEAPFLLQVPSRVACFFGVQIDPAFVPSVATRPSYFFSGEGPISCVRLGGGTGRPCWRAVRTSPLCASVPRRREVE